MAEPYFPDSAVNVLRATIFDPAARPGLELLSGSLIWDDERYLDFVACCRGGGCSHYWEPVVFRTSLILGRPEDECRPGWEELQRVCPEWPGFRPERRSVSLRGELERQMADEP